MYYFDVAIPLEDAESFKEQVLSTWFTSDEPTLTRHKDYLEYATYTFKSEYSLDIYLVEDIVSGFYPPYSAIPIYKVNWR